MNRERQIYRYLQEQPTTPCTSLATAAVVRRPLSVEWHVHCTFASSSSSNMQHALLPICVLRASNTFSNHCTQGNRDETHAKLSCAKYHPVRVCICICLRQQQQYRCIDRSTLECHVSLSRLDYRNVSTLLPGPVKRGACDCYCWHLLFQTCDPLSQCRSTPSACGARERLTD